MKIFKQNIIPLALSVLWVASVTTVRAQATDAHVEAALKLVDLGNAREAADDLRALTTQDPKNAEAHAGLAIALAQMNQVAQAAPEAQTGFDLNRHDALVRVARGIVYGKEGRVEDALNEFHQAISINDKDVGSMVALSRYYISIDSLKAAEITLYQAQGINDKDVRSYLGLAELYEKQHIPDLAINQYQSAMKLDPNDARVHAAIAGLYLRTYKYNESAKEWLEVIRIDSNYADAYYQIANLYFLAKQYPNSAAFAKKYVALKPNDIEGQWLYARALTESGAYQQALPALQAVSANDSLRPLAQLMLARSYFYTKDYPKALDIYKSANALSPQDLNFYGDALVVSGDTAGGIVQLQKSLVGDTDQTLRTQTQSAIGQLLYAQKRYEESAQVFAQMADANPSVNGYLSAGQIYVVAKKPELAKAYYDTAIALNPNSLKARMLMAIEVQSENAASDTALDAFNKLKAVADAAGSKDTSAIADGFIGYYYIANKDWKKAIEHLEPSVKTLETNNTPYLSSFENLLAGAYIQTQELSKAKTYYEKILKENPENEDAKKGLDYIQATERTQKPSKKAGR